jgi:hypothetical protein
MRPKPEICIVLHWEYPPSLRRWGALPRNVASMESPPYLSSVAMAIDLCHCGLQSCKSKVVEFVHSEAEIGPAQLMASQILKVIKEAEDLEIRGEDDGGDGDRDDDAFQEVDDSDSEAADDVAPGADELGGAADGGPADVDGVGSRLTSDDIADITALEQPGPSSTAAVAGDDFSVHAHVPPPPLAAAREVGEVPGVVDGPRYSFELRHVMSGVEIERAPRSAPPPFPRLRRAERAHDAEESCGPEVENPDNVSSDASPAHVSAQGRRGEPSPSQSTPPSESGRLRATSPMPLSSDTLSGRQGELSPSLECTPAMSGSLREHSPVPLSQTNLNSRLAGIQLCSDPGEASRASGASVPGNCPSGGDEILGGEASLSQRSLGKGSQKRKAKDHQQVEPHNQGTDEDDGGATNIRRSNREPRPVVFPDMTPSSRGAGAAANVRGGKAGRRGRGGEASANAGGSSRSQFRAPGDVVGSPRSGGRGSVRGRTTPVSTPVGSGAPNVAGSESIDAGGSQTSARRVRSNAGKSKKQSSKRADPVSGSNTDIVDLSAEGMMASMSEAPDTHMSPGR